MAMKYMKKSFSKMEPYHSALITDGIVINANESPYLPPKKVIDIINEEAKKIEFNRYPDMDERELDAAIAKHYGIKPTQVTVGVGSDELLDVMFRCVLEPGDTVLGFSPSFSMYQVFTELVGGTYIPVYGDQNMIFSIDTMIEKIKEYKPKMVLICTPNNPTGQFIEEADIRRVIESTDALIALDLAYIDFAKCDYAKIALEYDNVISFKTFSKAMALPSIRCGYAISKEGNIDMLNAVKAPYSVTTYSQIAAKAAIDNFDLYKDQIEKIKNTRDVLYKSLKEMGFNVYPSESNFLYVLMDKKYYDALTNNKIYIRRFKDGVYRISIGTDSDNKAILEVLKNA
ncbi:MAG: histidinol-phosphate transaminase [Acholeplasmatales bacterium]|nr:histidinol-phosphate transaminase [Acholeplasmatales bacterium]